MSAEAASLLIQATIASSAAMLLVTLVRKGLRVAVGARVAYWAWLLVPATAMAVLLPQPAQPVNVAAGALSAPVRAAMSGALHAIDRMAAPSYLAISVLAIWIAGALLSLLRMVRRHRSFVRSLGKATLQADGSLRADACNEPMLVGILRPRVVLPRDFDTRYGQNERAIVLAHEHAHLRRFDPQINALAAAWLGLTWFNPLMHWALRLFRFDQELACDASALARSGASPRGYADALLKTQLRADVAGHPAAMGCHWHSAHPLTERIHMLKRPLPGALRRRGGLALMLGLVFSGCYTVRTAQSQAAESPLVAINMKVFVDGVYAMPGDGSGWDVLMTNGGTFRVGDREHVESCITHLPRSGGIFLDCKLSHPNDQVFATPKLLLRDGEPSSIQITDTEHGKVFYIEFIASAAEDRVAATKALIQERDKGKRTFTLQKP